MYVTTPFSYFIHYNTLPSNLIDDFCKFGYSIYHNQKMNVKSLNPITNNDLYKNNIDLYKLCRKFCYKHLVPTYKFLKENMTESPKRDFNFGDDKIYFIPSVSVLEPGAIYEPIHNDGDWKLLSSIFYISDKGTGTLLYDNNKQFYNEITWKKGKGYSFIPTETAWHNYKNDSDGLRMALVINMTTRKLLPNRYK